MIATNTYSRSACLALGGGGARGLAHLGVVEVLKQSHISVERYVGVSIGGLAGAMCAIDGDIASVQKKAVDYLTSKAFQSKQVELFNAAPPADEAPVADRDHRLADAPLPWHHAGRQRHVGADHGARPDPDVFDVHQRRRRVADDAPVAERAERASSTRPRTDRGPAGRHVMEMMDDITDPLLGTPGEPDPRGVRNCFTAEHGANDSGVFGTVVP